MVQEDWGTPAMRAQPFGASAARLGGLDVQSSRFPVWLLVDFAKWTSLKHEWRCDCKERPLFSQVQSPVIMKPTPSKQVLLFSVLQSNTSVFELCLWSHLSGNSTAVFASQGLCVGV